MGHNILCNPGIKKEKNSKKKCPLHLFSQLKLRLVGLVAAGSMQSKLGNRASCCTEPFTLGHSQPQPTWHRLALESFALGCLHTCRGTEQAAEPKAYMHGISRYNDPKAACAAHAPRFKALPM